MASLSKQDYLKRYLSKEDDIGKKKSKKIKKATAKTSKIRIFDDDIDVKSLIPANVNNTLEDDIGDNDPTVAEFIDERPDHVKQLEAYRDTDRWKVLVKEDTSVFKNKDNMGDSDGSLKKFHSRKRIKDGHVEHPSVVRHRHDSDSDNSASRLRRRHDSDSDHSPTRRVRHDSDSDHSAARRVRHDSDSDHSPVSRVRHDSDSDHSPARRVRYDSDSDHSPVRRVRHDSDSDHSPLRKNRHDSDSDHSPVRESHSMPSPARKRQHDSDSEGSLKKQKPISSTQPSKNQKTSFKEHFSNCDSSPLRKRRMGSDSDHSPPRRKSRWGDADLSPKRKQSDLDQLSRRSRHAADSDHSPLRRKARRGDASSSQKSKNSDSDQSPKRRRHSDSDPSPPRRRRHSDSDPSPPRRKRHSDSDPSPPRKRPDQSDRRYRGTTKPVVLKDENDKMKKTLAGAKAGLSTAVEMRRETERLKKKENEAFSKIDTELLGRDAKTVFRDRKSGKRRNMKEEKELDEAEMAKKAVQDQKYKEWNQGLKQRADIEKNVTDAVYEMSKPFARYEDDKDLDEMMKNMEREGDPMLQFIKKKNKNANVKEKPKYKGPQPPPNRFGILPGYRWDGVDRTTGFEKKLFSSISDRKAVAEMAHKWSVEEM